MIYKYSVSKCKVKGYDYYKTIYRGSQKLFNIIKYGDEEAFKMANEYGEFLQKQDTESRDIKSDSHKYNDMNLEPFDIEKKFEKDVSFTCVSLGSTKSGKTTNLIKAYNKIYKQFDLIIIFSTSSHADIYKNFKKAILINKFDNNLVQYLYTLNTYLAENKKQMIKILFILDDIVTEKNNKTLLEMFCTMRNSAISTWLSIQSPGLIKEDTKNNFNFIFLHKMNDSKAYNEIVKCFFDGDIINKYHKIPEDIEKTVHRKREFIRGLIRKETSNYNFLVLDILNGNILYQNLK